MVKAENIEDFYMRKLNSVPDNLKTGIGHFNVFRLDDFMGPNAKPMPYSRKNYFKICLMKGMSRMEYADKVIDIRKQAVFFTNPQIPYNWEPLEEIHTGFFCIFTERFFHQFGNIRDYPVFQPNGIPVFEINDQQAAAIANIFDEMLAEVNSDYTYKFDLLRSLTFEVIHRALKMAPSVPRYNNDINANERISALFLELLERQFAVDAPQHKVLLRAPSDYAAQLSVHVNHLNRALKSTQNKTTSAIIAERLVQEAKILLKYTDWNISRIAFSLGFEEPSHFNTLFKKNLGLTPTAFRSV